MSEQQTVEKENVEIVNDLYAAFGRGDIEHIISRLRDDVRWFSHVDAIVPTSGDWSGKEKVSGFFKTLAEYTEVRSFTPREVVAQGDTVVSMGSISGRVKASGKTLLSNWVFIWKLRDGKVASYEQFHDGRLASAFR